MRHFLAAVALVALPTVLMALPPHGTSKNYKLGDDVMRAQIWPLQDFVMVVRGDNEISKGDFSKVVAKSVGRAFLDGHEMTACKITGIARHFNNVPGVYRVAYRC